jgi:hypothetical protein
MRSATRVGATVALLAATACTPVIVNNPPDPEPAPARRVSHAVPFAIPRGHLPPPGGCRVWLPGTPPGRQPKPRSCAGIERYAPPGSWIVYRPSGDRNVVHIREIDGRRSGQVVRRRVYDVRRDMLLQEY